jgi:Zn-dependent protease
MPRGGGVSAREGVDPRSRKRRRCRDLRRWLPSCVRSLSLSTMLVLAAVAWDTPLFWAVLIGWILTVVLHEFAHGLVAHWGGDYTIRERGGLSLNPLQYVDPLGSIILPAVFLAIGGIPLPGGATYIRHDLLRSKHWEAAVALAGPAMTFLLFVGFALPLHPAVGWVERLGAETWTNAQSSAGTMAVLQILACCSTCFPVPPLDGFQAIAPYMDQEQRLKLSTPPTSTICSSGSSSSSGTCRPSGRGCSP